MKKILAYRFSALGDVTMLLPVFRGIIEANPNVEIYFVTRKAFFPLFEEIPRLKLIEADLKGKHKNAIGLYSLYKSSLQTANPDIVIDLHLVIRTFLLDLFFKSAGKKVIYFKKERRAKRKGIKQKHLQPIKHTVERYKDTFLAAGCSFLEAPTRPQRADISNNIPSGTLLVGIAPFAKHKQKEWGLKSIASLMEKLDEKYRCTFILFGSQEKELNQLHQLQKDRKNCIVAKDLFSFKEELQFIPSLHLMVSMDSANMHLAATSNVPTISIWGPTHPSLGFSAYRQPAENSIQYNGDQIKCRPCSVYGKKKCIYPEQKCMQLITVEQITSRVDEILSTVNGSFKSTI